MKKYDKKKTTVDWNELWQKHFPHLSPKEAHAKLMEMFPEGEEE